jgi:hypothetical protein
MTAHQQNLYEQVIGHWRSLSLLRNPAVGLNELDRFEAHHNISLPAALRRLLLLSNGLVEGQYDPANFIRFCGIDEFVLDDVSSTTASDHNEHYLVFAEFSIWAHTYGLSMSSGHVAVIGGPSPIFVAKSLDEFLAMYLENSPALFPKSP